MIFAYEKADTLGCIPLRMRDDGHGIPSDVTHDHTGSEHKSTISASKLVDVSMCTHHCGGLYCGAYIAGPMLNAVLFCASEACATLLRQAAGRRLRDLWWCQCLFIMMNLAFKMMIFAFKMMI